MSIFTVQRLATPEETAAEMDRRGAVIERLETNVRHWREECGKIDAAKRAAEAKLSALQEEAGRLREALEPFAEIAELDIGEDEHDLDLFRPMATHNRGPLLRVGLFRRARSALARTAGGKDDAPAPSGGKR